MGQLGNVANNAPYIWSKTTENMPQTHGVKQEVLTHRVPPWELVTVPTAAGLLR